MAEIVITHQGDGAFRVEILEGQGRTTHEVTVPETLAVEFGVRDDPERLVRESFRFLLEREPASSILPRFSLEEISRYFPEYREELARRLS